MQHKRLSVCIGILALVITTVVIMSTISPTSALSLPGLDLDGIDPNSYSTMFIDLTNDEIEELVVCVQRWDEQRNTMHIYKENGSEWQSIYENEWYRPINLCRLSAVKLPFDNPAGTVLIVTQPVSAGAGWHPTYSEVIWWNGKEMRTIWSGQTELIDATQDDQMATIDNSILRFYIGNKKLPMLEMLTVTRQLEDGNDAGWEGVPVKVLSTTVLTYVWNEKEKMFVDM